MKKILIAVILAIFSASSFCADKPQVKKSAVERVKAIEAVGQEFNPDFHNAVMQVESEEYEAGIIAQELLKGYMYKDGVVRHSMVSVVQ